MSEHTARLLSGVPAINKAVYHRIRFMAHDPASIIELPGRSILVLRDVELERAVTDARADEVHQYEDFAPAGGLSGDREVRSAQATAECLKREGVTRVIADRTLPLLVADEIRRAGIELVCDRDLGVRERRCKDEQEVAAMREAQRLTESAIRAACEWIARADVGDDGVLVDDRGEPITSERVKALIDVHLAERRCFGEEHIVAGGPTGADCHFGGAGPLRTGEPIIVDVFPKHLATGYHGDCTRTVVHGTIPAEVAKMHDAIARAKAAGIEAVRAGVTGEHVHEATIAVLKDAGYEIGWPPDDAPDSYCTMPHGTGHGLGLDLKEPPLLDFGGPELIVGDAVTVEPGLYCRAIGGIRLEDLVIVTADGCTNLNELPEGLDWT
jgi:Xaa-Pro aminopeptidase